jgi:hypothetical protein
MKPIKPTGLAGHAKLDKFDLIAADFLQRIFGKERNQVFISDESDLDDFRFADIKGFEDWEDWDAAIVAAVAQTYLVELSSSAVTLLEVFELIDTRTKTNH